MVRRHDGDGLVDVVAVAGVWPIPPRQVSRRVVEPPADDLGEGGPGRRADAVVEARDDGDAGGGERLQPLDGAVRRLDDLRRDPAPDPQSQHVVEDDHVGAEVVRVQALAGLGVIDPLDRHTRQLLEEMIERRLIETVAAGDHEKRREPCPHARAAAAHGRDGAAVPSAAVLERVARPSAVDRVRGAAKRLAGELVRRGWNGVVELGAIGPNSRQGRRFGSFDGLAMITSRPPPSSTSATSTSAPGR